uniref:Truncated replication initiation protein n=1 Tax=Colecusatellite agerati TaxID=1260769 RepID=A0A6B7FR51_9VIRU|nr:truncated replication initiation protein [Ageratum enation alphasatellite]
MGFQIPKDSLHLVQGPLTLQLQIALQVAMSSRGRLFLLPAGITNVSVFERGHQVRSRSGQEENRETPPLSLKSRHVYSEIK